MTLDRYLLKQFFPVFVVAAAMFVLLLSLIDLFANLWRYLNYGVSLKQILTVCFYYLPKSFSYALPISLLFAAAYTLGDLYARNELTSIFSSGIPFVRFAMPLVVVGLCASLFAFFFEDRIVIPTFKIKNDMSRTLLHQQHTANNSDIVIKARKGDLIYSVDYFDEVKNILNGVNIVTEDSNGKFLSLIRAPQATWTGQYWKFTDAVIYQWKDDMLEVDPLPATDKYRETPATFKRHAVEVTDLSAHDARLLVQDLKNAGLPFVEAQVDYYHRFSWATVSLVVMILSISMGGRFRKNILLMSLLASLSAAVLFYVMEMITVMMAKLSYIPPLVGAWFPVVVFVILGGLLVRSAKT
jgi:lipopolysaccharide export system permease protein